MLIYCILTNQICQKKCWQCIFLETTDMFKLYISVNCNCIVIQVQCDNSVLMVWLGLGTKKTFA